MGFHSATLRTAPNSWVQRNLLYLNFQTCHGVDGCSICWLSKYDNRTDHAYAKRISPSSHAVTRSFPETESSGGDIVSESMGVATCSTSCCAAHAPNRVHAHRHGRGHHVVHMEKEMRIALWHVEGSIKKKQAGSPTVRPSVPAKTPDLTTRYFGASTPSRRMRNLSAAIDVAARLPRCELLSSAGPASGVVVFVAVPRRFDSDIISAEADVTVTR